MCETSFVSVTDTQMQYLATSVRQDLGFHHPPGIRVAFEGVGLIVTTWSFAHSWHENVFFSYFEEKHIKNLY